MICTPYSRTHRISLQSFSYLDTRIVIDPSRLNALLKRSPYQHSLLERALYDSSGVLGQHYLSLNTSLAWRLLGADDLVLVVDSAYGAG